MIRALEKEREQDYYKAQKKKKHNWTKKCSAIKTGNLLSIISCKKRLPLTPLK